MRRGGALLLLACAAGLLLWWAMGGRAEQARRAERSAVGRDESPLEPAPTQRAPGVDAVAEGGLRFRGCVVDSDGAPAEGADIEVAIEGQNPLRGVADRTGGFRFPGGPRPPGEPSVHVVATRGALAATRSLVLDARMPDDVNLKTLVLGPARDLVVVVVHDGKPVAGATVVAGPPWAHGPFLRTGADGRATARLLPPGKHDLRVSAEGLGRARASADVPAQAEVTVALPGERAVTVTVADKASGAPIAGATFVAHARETEARGMVSFQVPCPPLEVPATDANGRAVLRGLAPESELMLAVRAPGYPPPQLRFGSVGSNLVPAGATEVRIEIDPPRTIRWPVVAKEQPVPPSGTRVTLKREPGSYLQEVPAEGEMSGADLIVSGWGPGPVHAIAQAPDGSLARLRANGDVGAETWFRAPRHVEVSAREPHGTPVPGIVFVLRNQGNNEMAPPLATDAEGKARFEGLYGQLADVYVRREPADYGRRVGSVDLEKGSGRVDLVLEPEIDLVVRLRVDGQPRVPRAFELLAGGEAVNDYALDAAEAEVRAKVRPPRAGELEVVVNAPGLLPAKGIARDGVVTLDLEPAGVLVVDVAPPVDGEFRIEPQRWEEALPGWLPLLVGQGGPLRYERLAGGRYRVRDARSGCATEPVDIVPGGPPAKVRLDLTRAGWVTGRVYAPAGTDMAAIRIVTDGLEVAPSAFGWARPDADGTFRVRVPGDRDIVFRASHPLLAAEGSATVRLPRDGVILRLRPGPVATLRLDRPPKPVDVATDGIGILLFDGGISKTPRFRLRAQEDGAALSFGGFEPGTYTLWLAPDPFAPIVLEGIVLGDGATDLGTVKTSDGARLKIRVVVPEGQSAPRIMVSVMHAGEPRYARNLQSGGEAEVVVGGLGKGTFDVFAGRELSERVDLDGETERVLTLDLR